MKLEHQIGLITGGTKGIGAATAIALAEAGADVAIVGRNLDAEAKETGRSIEELGRKCRIIVADVSVPSQATRCVEETTRALGSVDVLVAFRVKVSNSQMQDREVGYRLRVKMAPAEGQYRIANIDQVAK